MPSCIGKQSSTSLNVRKGVGTRCGVGVVRLVDEGRLAKASHPSLLVRIAYIGGLLAMQLAWGQ